MGQMAPDPFSPGDSSEKNKTNQQQEMNVSSPTWGRSPRTEDTSLQERNVLGNPAQTEKAGRAVWIVEASRRGLMGQNRVGTEEFQSVILLPFQKSVFFLGGTYVVPK